MRTRRGLPQWPDLPAARSSLYHPSLLHGRAFCPSLLSLFGRYFVWNHHLRTATNTAALPTFSRSVPLKKKLNGILCMPQFARDKQSSDGRLEQSNATLQCGNRQKLVCASGYPASKYRPRIVKTLCSLP